MSDQDLTGTLTGSSELLNSMKQKQSKQENTEGGQRFVAVISVFLISIGVFFWFQTEIIATAFSYDYTYEYATDQAKQESLGNIKALAGFFLLFSTVFISYLFMVGFNPIKSRKKINIENSEISENDEKKEIIELLCSISSSIEKSKLESSLSEKERNEIVSGLSATIERQLNDNLLEKIESKYGNTIYRDKLTNKAETLLNSTIDRLDSYNSDLKKKATVNLLYGVAATISAIMILVFLLMNTKAPISESQIDTIFYYTSRLLLVLLVQGISISFLNLYKSTLNNILYINNEITNHESKRDALLMSLGGEDSNNLSNVLTNLSNTERNFVLKKGETSIFDNGGQQLDTSVSSSVVVDLINKMGNK